MGSRQDAKQEKIIKELLRLPDNRRCVNCDSLGPQYVLSNYNVFICTACSGVHREFGHRVKGISLSKFLPEEVQALKNNGNGVFAATYLANWTPTTLGKPLDRTPAHIKSWIQAVYIDARFKGTPKAPIPQPPSSAPNGVAKPSIGSLPLPSPSASRATSSASNGVLERKLSDILGMDTPKITVTSPSKRAAEGPDSGTGHAVAQSAAVPALPSGWAAFGDGNGPVTSGMPGPAVATSAAAPTSTAPPAVTSSIATAAAGPAVAAPPAPVANGWEAFGEASVPENNGNTVPPTEHKVNGNTNSSLPPATAPVEEKPKPAPRLEVPLDIFYPEFNTIRATGMLPTGQPVPPPGYPVASTSGIVPSTGLAPNTAQGYNPALAALYGSAVAPPVVAARGTPGSSVPPAVAIPSPSASTTTYSPASLRSATTAPWYAPAPTPANGAPDAFAGLGLSLGASLPSAPNTARSASAPGQPPDSYPSPPATYAPHQPTLPTISSAPQLSPARAPSEQDIVASSTATTLFGKTPVMYDLNAVAAPRPAPTGNPFA